MDERKKDLPSRLLLNKEKSITNDVSYVLTKLGFTKLVLEKNPRTGKKVKTLKLVDKYIKPLPTA